ECRLLHCSGILPETFHPATTPKRAISERSALDTAERPILECAALVESEGPVLKRAHVRAAAERSISDRGHVRPSPEGSIFETGKCAHFFNLFPTRTPAPTARISKTATPKI